MTQSHRHGDLRTDAETTVVSGQSFVTIDGKLWAVQNDQDTAGGGQLISSTSWITIDGKPIIINGDKAQPDTKDPRPDAASGSSTVQVG
jgi:uncharacterized Zn-binding protein involved in type VI secretion